MGTDSRLVCYVALLGSRSSNCDQSFSLRVKTCPVNNLKLEEKQSRCLIRRYKICLEESVQNTHPEFLALKIMQYEKNRCMPAILIKRRISSHILIQLKRK